MTGWESTLADRTLRRHVLRELGKRGTVGGHCPPMTTPTRHPALTIAFNAYETMKGKRHCGDVTRAAAEVVTLWSACLKTGQAYMDLGRPVAFPTLERGAGAG